MKFVLGLTGQTGAGKTTAQQTAEKAGYFVIDCDKVARQATNNGNKALSALVCAFGEEILETDGSLNRKKLALIAFSSKKNTEKLNGVILPFIVKDIKERIKSSEAEKILLDAPTLFESGIDSICDKTVAVLADKEIRKNRIISRDNLSEEQALMRIRAGKEDDFFAQKCDYVIYNNESEENFIKNFEIILKNISGGR